MSVARDPQSTREALIAHAKEILEFYPEDCPESLKIRVFIIDLEAKQKHEKKQVTLSREE